MKKITFIILSLIVFCSGFASFYAAQAPIRPNSSSQKNFACNTCPRTFTTEKGLRIHNTTACKKTYHYECALCRYPADQASRIRDHLLEAHLNQTYCSTTIQMPYCCEVCGEKWALRSQADYGKRKHTNCPGTVVEISEALRAVNSCIVKVDPTRISAPVKIHLPLMSLVSVAAARRLETLPGSNTPTNPQ